MVRIYDSEFPSNSIEVIGVNRALGVSWNETEGTLAITVPSGVIFVTATAESLSGSLVATRDINGTILLSKFGKFGLAPALGTTDLQAFNPTAAAQSENPISCGSSSSVCKSVSVSGLPRDGQPALPDGAEIERAVVYHEDESAYPVAYLVLTTDFRLGVARIDDNFAFRKDDSGMLDLFDGQGRPRSMTLSKGKYLLVGSGEAPTEAMAVSLQAANNFLSHNQPEPMTLPAGACPAALDSTRSDSALLMADDCTGSLWELPLDEEGRPTGEDPVLHSLGDKCKKPFKLASLPASGEEEALTFVGCEGENYILVHNRN